jgi:hypothetical protein
MKNPSFRLKLYGVLLGFSIAMITYLGLKPEFHLSSRSEHFVPFLAFVFLSISFLIGLILSVKEIKDRSTSQN